MSKVILIAGTWGLSSDFWWRPGSELWQLLKHHGCEMAAADDPYIWSTALDGLRGENETWICAAAALRWFCGAKGIERPNIVAHSHGGQVALLASEKMQIGTLITVATPVRDDVLAHSKPANINRWIHIHTNGGDRMQIAGELGDSKLEPKREMPGAGNIYEPNNTHSGLLEVKLWQERDWGRYCT